jgi:ATP synthase protein I
MQANDARLLRGSAVPTAVVGVIAMVVGTVAGGPKGLLGAAFGAVLVIGFFALGLVAVGRITQGNPILIMNMGMLTYLLQVGALAIVLFLFQDTKAFDTKVFALTILAGAIVWVVAQVRVFGKLKIAYVEPDGER